MHAEDFGCEDVDRLSEHGGFRFNAADTPSDDAESVNHRGMRIGADDGIGIGDAFFCHHDLREVFEIYLMDDADGRRDDVEFSKRLLSPFEEFIPFFVAFKFAAGIELKGVFGAVSVHLNGMIYD